MACEWRVLTRGLPARGGKGGNSSLSLIFLIRGVRRFCASPPQNLRGCLNLRHRLAALVYKVICDQQLLHAVRQQEDIRAALSRRVLNVNIAEFDKAGLSVLQRPHRKFALPRQELLRQPAFARCVAFGKKLFIQESWACDHGPVRVYKARHKFVFHPQKDIFGDKNIHNSASLCL